jgi:hypothetical protein
VFDHVLSHQHYFLLGKKMSLFIELSSLSPPLPSSVDVSTSVDHHHHQWRYSPGWALASLTGFVIVRYITMWLSAPRSAWF